MREAPEVGERGFFYTTFLLAPDGVDLTLHTHTAFQAWIGATLLRRLSVIEAQNIVILGSLALNGFCAYLLAFDRLRRWWPSVAAGCIFGAAPYLGAHLLGHFNLIAISDCEGEASAHTSLTPQCATEPLHGIEQFPPEHRIIHLIRLERDGLFKTRLNGGMEDGRMIDPLCPSEELPRIVADGEFKCLKWTLGHVS